VEPEFWHARWRTGQIGFHQSSPNPLLERWWPTLGVPAGDRVYVPLCGKSLDMVWLAVRGHQVVGSELSAVAAQDFFGAHGANSLVESIGPFQRHRGGAFEILEGDALQLTPELLGPVQAAYDRAGLVALPPALRRVYAKKFAELLPAGAHSLLIAFEYDQALKEGPPFSVEGGEIQQLYASNFVVRELERIDIIDDSPKFSERGVKSLHEVAWHLTRR